MSRQNEEYEQWPETLGHSIRMLAPRGTAGLRQMAWGGRWLTPSVPSAQLEVHFQGELNLSRI